jgi:predicted glycosyltransferase
MRFLFYSHDGFGMGHTCRNLAIARALVAASPKATVLLATGSDDTSRLGVPERVEILKLPSLRKLANERYGSRTLVISESEIRALRARLLSSAIETFWPDVVLVDKHPFGANGELRDGMERLRDHGGRSVLGLRDILDDPETVAAEWRPHGLPDRITDFYDRVLVYGQREVFDSVAAYGFPSALAARTAYCGYVSASDVTTETPPHLPASIPDRLGSATDDRAVVLATVGGGEDGFHLLRAFLEGAADAPWQSVAVTGPLICNGELKELTRLAQQSGARLHRFVPRLEEWFGTASAVVCMGGYNTVTQGLQSGASLVCVPRTQPRREQWIRAEEFSRLGLLQTVHPEHLHADSLRDAVTRALQVSRPQLQQHIQQHLRFDGAAVAAHHLLALARARRGMRRPSHRNPTLAPA